MDDKERRDVSHQYVWNKQQFEDVDASNTDYLLGECPLGFVRQGRRSAFSVNM